MKYITAHHMRGFVSELETAGLTEASKEAGAVETSLKHFREAVSPGILSRIGSRLSAVGDVAKNQIVGRYGRQLALGAGLGAVGGAATGDEENWKGRALKGALLGGGLAGGRILATKAGREAAKGGLSRFGERQLYTLTGKGYKGREIDLESAKKLGIIRTPNFEQLSDKPGMLERAKSRLLGGTARSPLLQEAHRHAADVESFQKGFQNVPGVIHGALTRPGALLRSGWQRAGTTGKLFAAGGLASAGHGMLKTPEDGGPGRFESGLRSAGSTLGYLAAPGSLLGASIVAGMGGKALGGAGKVGDVAEQVVKARRAAEQPQGPETSYLPAQDEQINPAEWR